VTVVFAFSVALVESFVFSTLELVVDSVLVAESSVVLVAAAATLVTEVVESDETSSTGA
jgi:hypothetical protein